LGSVSISSSFGGADQALFRYQDFLRNGADGLKLGPASCKAHQFVVTANSIADDDCRFPSAAGFSSESAVLRREAFDW
jgi:hypothetical protein